jgi:hypothetical protein
VAQQSLEQLAFKEEFVAIGDNLGWLLWEPPGEVGKVRRPAYKLNRPHDAKRALTGWLVVDMARLPQAS